MKKLREFYYGDFCDFYLESTKPVLKTENDLIIKENIWNILKQCNNHILLLYHPFIPSITEELWQRINQGDNFESILDYRYPCADNFNNFKNFNETEARETVKIVRNIVNNCLGMKKSLPTKEKPSVLIKNDKTNELENFSKEIIHLGKLNNLEFNFTSDSHFKYCFNFKVNDSCDVVVRFKVKLKFTKLL